jgi:hypothetical protein
MYSGIVAGQLIRTSISTVSATEGNLGDNAISRNVTATLFDEGLSIPSWRLAVPAPGPQTVYLIGKAIYSSGTVTGYGRISATRAG